MISKPHVCHWPNCGKTFTRAEHLRRHALNHEQVRNDYTCERCFVHFNRPDLLSRHMARHAKRDEEAGGPGLGILETRKRTRRTPNGTIVTRPAKRQARKAVPDGRDCSSSCNSVDGSQEQSHRSPGSDNCPHGAPVSPPQSAPLDGHDQYSDQELDESDSLLAPMMPGGPYEPYVEPIPGQFDAADGSWGASTQFEMTEDSFGNDTATDFNMPFAATHNYNWLFDVSSLDDAFNHLDWPLEPNIFDATHAQDPMHLSVEEGDTCRQTDSKEFPGLSHSFTNIFNQDPSSILLEAASFIDKDPCASTLSQATNHQTVRRPFDYPEMDWMTGYPAPSAPRHYLPQLSEEARVNILALVSLTQLVDSVSPLLSLGALQTYCDLFFARFNVVYPLIHQATFDPNRVDRVFLAAILCLGATYSSREAHQLAVGIHDSLRNHLFCRPDFSPQPDLWVLQTMLLIDCFGKMRAGSKQRDRAQLFHCVLIKMIRRSDCCAIQTSSISDGPEGLEQSWIQAMEAEQRKRLAMHCFMWDTQHAVLFSQSLCMSAFEMRFHLPCGSSAWEASTPEQWFHHASQEPSHSFLSVLKGYITPHTVSRPRHLSPLARVFVLHGLMSLSSDLKRRDQTTLRAETPELVGAWKPRIGRSYDLWKVDFDAGCMAMKLGQESSSRWFASTKMAAHALYRTAHITLNVEVLDLQIRAGAPHILGRSVTTNDIERSRRNMPRWLQDPSGMAPRAAKHASFILQDAVMSLDDWDDADAFHFPWCLYLATLTCWAFHLAEKGDRQSNAIPQDDEQAKNEMSSLIVAMTTCSSLDELASLAGKYPTRGLVKVMAQRLASVRWAVVHDAMKVLIQLAG